MSELEDETRGFRVTDRRSFTAQGERRRASEAEESSVDESPQKTAAAPEEPRAVGGQTDVYFLELLSLLATQATLHLGQLHPEGEEPREDLPAAQVMIAMIETLKKKTRGNLSEEEDEALEEVLYQLRMQFVAKARGSKA